MLTLHVMQLIFGLAWSWRAATRIKIMTAHTRWHVKFAFAVFGAGGLFLAFEPWAGPDYGSIFLTIAAGSVVYVQWATAGLWMRGVPYQFELPDRRGTSRVPDRRLV